MTFANKMKTLIQLLIVKLSLSACSTNAPHSGALESGHWRKVKDKPPTYFPVGVDKDHPIGFDHGYWIETGDANGTRFFVPLRNTRWPSEELIAEAQDAMSPQAKKELKVSETHSLMIGAGGGVLQVIGTTIYVFARCISGV